MLGGVIFDVKIPELTAPTIILLSAGIKERPTPSVLIVDKLPDITLENRG